jgi:hypothetical protein
MERMSRRDVEKIGEEQQLDDEHFIVLDIMSLLTVTGSLPHRW